MQLLNDIINALVAATFILVAIGGFLLGLEVF